MANFTRSNLENWASAIGLIMAGFAMVLLIYAAACSVIIQFAYRHVIAAPTAWLLSRLGGLAWRS
jgi:hypothetical protein